jgi:hypothetical protein
MLSERDEHKDNGVVERTRRQRLPQLLGLVAVRHTQCVQVLGAADLELCLGPSLLDLYGLGILPPGCQEEVLDLVNLLRLQEVQPGINIKRLQTMPPRLARKSTPRTILTRSELLFVQLNEKREFFSCRRDYCTALLEKKQRCSENNTHRWRRTPVTTHKSACRSS